MRLVGSFGDIASRWSGDLKISCLRVRSRLDEGAIAAANRGAIASSNTPIALSNLLMILCAIAIASSNTTIASSLRCDRVLNSELRAKDWSERLQPIADQDEGCPVVGMGEVAGGGLSRNQRYGTGAIASGFARCSFSDQAQLGLA